MNYTRAAGSKLSPTLVSSYFAFAGIFVVPRFFSWLLLHGLLWPLELLQCASFVSSPLVAKNNFHAETRCVDVNHPASARAANLSDTQSDVSETHRLLTRSWLVKSKTIWFRSKAGWSVYLWLNTFPWNFRVLVAQCGSYFRLKDGHREAWTVSCCIGALDWKYNRGQCCWNSTLHAVHSVIRICHSSAHYGFTHTAKTLCTALNEDATFI